MENLGILGLGISGYQAALLAVKLGYKVRLSEKLTEAALSAERVLKLRSLDVELELGKNTPAFFNPCSRIVLSPGISPNAPIIRELIHKGHTFISDLDLAYENIHSGDWIGITGTNGKTTTTDLLGKMISAQYKTFVGGNLGSSPCNAHGTEPEKLVLELSSYQLDITNRMKLKGGMILNIREDHLNRYGTMEKYIESKKKIALLTREYLLLNREETILYNTYQDRDGAFFISLEGNEDCAVFFDGEYMNFTFPGIDTRIPSSLLKLPGRHNVLNAMFASSSALLEGVDESIIRSTLEDYQGLHHRIEPLGEINGIEVYNDSKSTTPDSTKAAISSFQEKNVLLIIGGSDEKGSDFTVLEADMNKYCRKVYPVGDAGRRIAETLKAEGMEKPMTIEEALKSALSEGKSGEIILFSPGTPSFDRFTNYEQRGEYFRKIVDEEKRN